MGNVEESGVVFRTTVWARPDLEVAALCDPFWTLQNGGYCSDAMGNYIRRDGTVVPVEELTGDRQQLVSGIDNSTLVVIALAAIGIGLLMRNG